MDIFTAAQTIGNGILNNPINPANLSPAIIASGLTNPTVIPFRPWNIIGNWFNRTPAQIALLKDISTPGKKKIKYNFFLNCKNKKIIICNRKMNKI